MKVLVLGASGMLGNAAMRVLGKTDGIDVYATVRSPHARMKFDAELQHRFLVGIDVLNHDSLLMALSQVRPDVVLNCVGLIKQLETANDPLWALPINAMFPHRLARACELSGARLVHVSTDCVFSGKAGGYTELDLPDATDLYGRSKLLGEVAYANAITLRTSIIGRELDGQAGLVDWFLAQTGTIKGYTNAIFSGVTTDELTKIIVNHVLPDPTLSGVWHVSSTPIAKYDLLLLIRDAYGHDVQILSDGALRIDRSLDSTLFKSRTGYVPPTWETMIDAMRKLEEK